MTTPATSTIANAMGRASSTAAWLAKPESLPDGHTSNAPSNPDRSDLLDKLKVAIRQNRPEAADSTFFEWLENRSGSASALNTRDNLLFGHEFVREMLDIVLQSPSKSTAALYPAKMVCHLLEKRVVSASMLPPNLLGHLLESKDWVSSALTCKRYTVLSTPSLNSAPSN
jgi:hypothetical protein